MSWLNGSKPLLALVFPNPLQDAKHDCRPKRSQDGLLCFCSPAFLQLRYTYSDGIHSFLRKHPILLLTLMVIPYHRIICLDAVYLKCMRNLLCISTCPRWLKTCTRPSLSPPVLFFAFFFLLLFFKFFFILFLFFFP